MSIDNETHTTKILRALRIGVILIILIASGFTGVGIGLLIVRQFSGVCL